MSSVRMSGVMVWMVIAALLAGGCSSAKLSTRHQETGLNSAFQSGPPEFAAYVDRMRGLIARTRTDLTPENRERVIEWNSPFILAPNPATCPRGPSGRTRNGILLIHGLTESPFQMRDLGEYFRRRCFLVYGLLLPGHGTVPGDLLEVTYEEWMKATRFGVEALESKVENYYLGGASTGASLALYAALTGSRPRGLMLIVPAIRLQSGRASIGKILHAIFGLDVTRYWGTLAGDGDTTKYESFTVNGAFQVWRFTRALAAAREQAPLTIPVFAAIVEGDMSVDSLATLDYLKAAAPPGSRVLIYGKLGANAHDPRIVTRANAWPEEHVLGQSHLSLTVAPDNPHHGRRGDYRNCLTYLDDPPSWELCQREDVPAGEVTPENLARRVMRRLTYNPDFPGMLSAVDDFLNSLD